MKNTIKINIEFASVSGLISIEHNGQLMQQAGHSGLFTVECKDLGNTNCLDIFADVDLYITQLSMFDLGQEKLVYQGLCVKDHKHYQSQHVPAGYRWQVKYSSPVFGWLHSVLNHGWLVSS